MNPSPLARTFVAATPASEVIPVDAVFPSTDPGKVVEGLTAVGVPLAEALCPYVASLDESKIIGLVLELEPDPLARMQVLYDLYKDTPQWHGPGTGLEPFAKACVAAGFSPVGVATCAIKRGVSGQATGMDEASRLLDMFQVECRFMHSFRSDGTLVLDLSDLKVAFSPMVVSCGVDIRAGDNDTPVSVGWLTVVGGTLNVLGANIEFPHLSSVGGLEVSSSTNLSFPVLKTSKEVLGANRAKDISLPELAQVGGSMSVGHSVGLSIPKLNHIGNHLFAADCPDLALPSLELITGELHCRDAKALCFPSLKSVGMSVRLDRTVDCSFPVLEQVKEQFICEQSEKLSCPNLVSVGSLNAAEAELLEMPLLAEVLGGCVLTTTKGLCLPSLVKLTGTLYADGSAGLLLPGVKRVSVALVAYGSDGLFMPALEEVDGRLECSHTKLLKMPNLVKITTGLKMEECYHANFDALEVIGGNLEMKHAIGSEFPKLKKVSGTIFSFGAKPQPVLPAEGQRP